MLTVEDIRKALDLVPFEGFARKQLASLERARISEMLTAEATTDQAVRNTGRSTRMICSALAVVSAGRPVAIYAKPMLTEHALKDRAQEWAEKLGLNSKLIHGHLASTAEVEFFDHTWYDAP